MLARVVLLATYSTVLFAQDRALWNEPNKPFQIYGNTYYVGTRGLSAALVTSPAGHVLIDAALPESAPQITANIRSLGFRVEDIRWIVTSHVHFDHAGGVAELQKLSGAQVAASPWSADVMRNGAVPRSDPQFGSIPPIAKVAKVTVLKDGEALKAGTLEITAHFTPGHTPGGTSWSWRSCESNRCLDLVYADSLTPVSADDFFYTSSKVYPNALQDLQRSYAYLDKANCDILVTPHPDFSRLFQRLAQRAEKPDAMIDPGGCHALVADMRERLRIRIETEAKTPEAAKSKGR